MTDYTEFHFFGRVENVVDGDTIDVSLDLGFNVTINDIRIRLRRVDTAEEYFVSEDTDEYETAMEQKRFTCNWLTNAELGRGDFPIVVRTDRPSQRGEFGRWIGDVYDPKRKEYLSHAILRTFGDRYQYQP